MINRLIRYIFNLAIIGVFSACVFSCGHFNKLPLNKYEKTSLGINAGLQIADYATTKKILSGGGIELNPIYGSHPGDKELLLGKAGGFLAIYLITKCLPSHKSRKYFLNTANIIIGGAVIHNFGEL